MDIGRKQGSTVLAGEQNGQSPGVPLQRGVLRVAVTIRGLRRQHGASTFFFTPVSSDGGSIVQRVADALSRIDSAPILLVDIRSGKVDAIGPTPPPAQVASGILTNLQQIAPAREVAPAQEIMPSLMAALTRPSGESGLAMVLLSEKSLSFMEEAKRSFAYVLIDGPSVLTEPAGMLAAQQCDGTILTVTSGRTKLSRATQAKQQLERANANVIGFVIEEPN